MADPYVWDDFFEVFHARLDQELVVLFNIMQDLKDYHNSVDVLNDNKNVFRDYFDYEEAQFMACGESCDAGAHKRKPDIRF